MRVFNGRHTGYVALAVLAIVMLAAPAAAQVSHYDVRVDGLACPFCAYGLEKKVKALRGAQNVHIELDRGLVSFDVTGETDLLPDVVEKAVRDSGFTARGFTIRASGSVTRASESFVLDSGGARLRLVEGAAFDRLRDLVEQGHHRVRVTGTIRQVGGVWQVSVAEARAQEEAR